MRSDQAVRQDDVLAKEGLILFSALCEKVQAALFLLGFSNVIRPSRRSSRCCGNVETRVLCGFPSSEGGTGTLRLESHHYALGAAFPQLSR